MVDELNDLVRSLTDKITNLEARVELLESTISIKSNTIDLLKAHVERLEERSVNQEQYQRRTSLRIHGVPVVVGSESNQDVLKIVEEVHKQVKVPYSRANIFRAHRIGPKKKIDNNVTQAIIVKFNDWDARCALYRARPTRKKPIKDIIFKSISLDLAKDRIGLLEKARERIKNSNLDANEVYAFADINCNLTVRFGQSDFRYFDSEKKLEEYFD